MTTSAPNRLDDLIAIKPKTEYLRLVSLELGVATDEQLAKSAETARRNGNTAPMPRASLRVTWEPLSYNIRGLNGNLTTDYIDVSFTIDPNDLERVRTSGWLGIPDRRLIRMDEKLPAEAQRDVWPRYRARTKDIMPIDIDIDGSITGKVGQPYSNLIGHVFEVTEGMDSFPRNVQVNGKWTVDATNPRRTFMRYPVALADDYVAPADVPVRIPRNASTEAGAVVDTDAIRRANTDTLRAACVESGLVGMLATDLSGMSKQVNFLAKHMEDSAATIVFGTADLNNAANEGDLLTFLESKGAITINTAGFVA